MMLQSTLGSPSAARKECRAYRCESCNLWHLTSMSLEDYEASLLRKSDTIDTPQYLFEMN